MKLHLLREPTKDDRTFGALYIDGVWQCWTLEDAIRQPGPASYHAAADRDAWVAGWKVKGQTAIPFGTYRVTLTHSPRFKQILPLLHDVPGFTGVRIHAGNTIDDTEGCVLVGLDRTSVKVLRSAVAFAHFMDRLREAHDRVTLAVLPPLPWGDAPLALPATNARPVNV